MKIEIKISGDETRIYINDLLHLLLTDRIIGIQSYIKEDKWFCIDFSTKYKNITVEYDSFDKWERILKEINKLL